MNPLISIIVPVYNTAQFLPRCLDSLIKQTLREIEIICIDDGSSDESTTILKEYAERDSRVHPMYQKHAGPGTARNTGLSAASGKYVLFVDSDDFVELNMCTELYQEMENANSDIILFDYNVIRGGVRMRKNRFAEFASYLLGKPFRMADISKYQCILSKESWHDIYRTSFLRKYKIRFLNTTMGEDFFFWNMLFAANPKAKVISKVYYNYVKRDDSAIPLAVNYYKEGLRASMKSLDIIINSSLPQDAIYNYVLTNVKWINVRFSMFHGIRKARAEKEMIKMLRSYAQNVIIKKRKDYLLPIFSPYLSGKKRGSRNTSRGGIFKRILFSITKRLLKWLQPCFEKNTYILCDNLYERHAGCVDTYVIFLEMQKRGIPSYYVIWKENLFYDRLKREKNLKNVIALKRSVTYKRASNYEFWFKVFPHLFRTKALLISFSLYNPSVNRAFHKNKYITFHQVGHACTFFKIYPIVNRYFSKDVYNKYACCNESEAELFVKYGKWEKANLPITGSCRWDQLRRLPHDRKAIFIMFTWRISFAPWNKSKFNTPLVKTKYYTGIHSLMHDENFVNLVREHHLRLLFCFHHSAIDQAREVPTVSDLCGDGVEIVDPTNIASYIAISDMLITDYSSVFFDFSFLNIPTVFYRPDFDDNTLLLTDRSDMKNAMEKDRELYNVFYTKDDAIRCVRKYVDNGFVLEEGNRKKIAKFFPRRENITDSFIKYLETL